MNEFDQIQPNNTRLPTTKFMKTKYLLLFATLSLALPLQALEQTTFYNTDKSKSFAATLVAYNAKTKKVSVRLASGAQKSFAMSVLAKESQDYVIAKEDRLAIGNSVRLKFTEVKVKGSGDGVATSYAIEVRNAGEKAIQDIQLSYTLYYRQGDLDKGGTIAKTSSGKLSTGKIYDADTLTVSTQSVEIVRKSKPASGGG